MPKVFFISPIGKSTPDLFPSFIPTLKERGYEVVGDLKDADMIFFDIFSWLVEYDSLILNGIVERNIPIVFFDESDYGGCVDGTDTWFFHKVSSDGITLLETFIMMLLQSKTPMIYFMRKMDKIKEFPSWVVPYEKCLYKECISNPVSKEELFNRPYDICWIGNGSPTRQNTVNGLLKAGFNMYVHWTHEQGKIPHDEWMNLHKQSKMFLTSDGGGYGDERPHQLMFSSVMLRQRNNQLIAHNFRDGLDCLEVSENPEPIEIQNIQKLLNDEELLHHIYLNGIHRLNRYFTEPYRANYILDTIEKQLA
jgi:hypothetical protein